MAVWSTNNFTGGMNDYVHPSLLEPNTAVRLENAKLDDGKLVSFKRSSLWDVEEKTSEDFGVFSSGNRSAVKWYDRHYWSYNGGTQAPYYGTDTSNFGGPGVPWDKETHGNALGIPHCVYDENEATGQNPPPVPTFEIGETDDSDGLLGVYKYCVTLVDWNGFESAPGSLTSYFKELEVGSTETQNDETVEHRRKVSISLTAEDLPVNIRYAKVYRTIDHGADFYFVGVLYDQKEGDRNPDGLDDNNFTLEDDTSDSILTMRNPLTTTDYDLPPDKGKYLCESGGVFFLAVGSRLYYSVQDNPHAWPTLNYIGFDDTITGIAPEFSGVLVFTRMTTWRVTGAESQATISRTLVPGHQGCIKYTSIASVSNAPVWVSHDGICLWNGESVQVVNYRRLKLDNPQIINACSTGDKYYLFLENGVVVYDQRNGGVFYWLSVHVDYAWVNELDGIIYYQSGKHVYVLEGSSLPLGWRYVSPYIGGTEMLQRVYRQIIVACDSDTTLTVYLEDKKKLAVSLPAGRQRVKLPLNFVGRWLQIELFGTGRLSEVSAIYGDD